MVAGLETSHKVGILIVAGVFVAFALLCSFVFPKMSPNFPGKHIGLFAAAAVGLTILMLATIVVLAKEPKEEHETVAETTTTETTPPPPAPAAGDKAAGKALFAAQGCGSCHTFEPAGATAKVGPNLADIGQDAQKAQHGSVEQYTAESIVDPAAYTVPGYPSGTMPPFKLTAKQVADLVAFLGTGTTWDKG